MSEDGSLLRADPGAVLGRYRVLRKLGAGAMGIVVEAEHLDLRKRVALKVLRAELISDAVVVERFVREGHAAARVRHPNVLDVTDVGREKGVPFLVMELLEGETLAERLARGPMEHGELAALMLPVCAGVAAAHAERVLHRDLKPENIFLARTALDPALPKVLDFGIAKIAEDGAAFALTESCALLGTPYYVAPEQALGAQELDARSDQYALGVILYEGCAGRRPFAGSSLLALASAITRAEYTPLRTLAPAVPVAFEEVVRRAMSLNPADRFESVQALGRALLPFVDARTSANWHDAFEPTPAALTLAADDISVSRAPAPSLDETLGGPRPSVGERIPLAPRASSSTWRWATVAALLAGVTVAHYLSRARGGAPSQRAVAVVPASAGGGSVTPAPSDQSERRAAPTAPTAPTRVASRRPEAPPLGAPRRPSRAPRPQPIAPGRREIPLE